ncbi:uncharacterized protein LOC108215138 isoform X4 [Daucus carota subsp. sativus]|nr:PREDICTED: uncharacterized protein LOC108215138 isoform X3 [Daucus carota subsp. sativus]
MEFAGVIVEKWVKVLTNADLDSDEMRLPPKFVKKYVNRLKTNSLLKFRNGYEIATVFNHETGTFSGLSTMYEDFLFEVGQMLVFEFDGSCDFNVYVIDTDLTEVEYPPVLHHTQSGHPRVVSVKRGGLKFVYFVKEESPLYDELEPPASFKRSFRFLPGYQNYIFSNGKKIDGVYNNESGKFKGLSKFCSILGLENFSQFNLVLFTYEEHGMSSVAFFDDHFVEVLFPGTPLSIGQNSENPTATGRIEIVVKPCHMYQYSYGVDVSTVHNSITAFWKKTDYINLHSGERSWKVQVKCRGVKNRRSTINNGWIQLREDLGLVEGDIVVLECAHFCGNHFALHVVKNDGA